MRFGKVFLCHPLRNLILVDGHISFLKSKLLSLLAAVRAMLNALALKRLELLLDFLKIPKVQVHALKL